MIGADLFAPHLQPGEHVLWSASASDARLRAARQRVRLVSGLSGAAAAVIALLLAVRFFESLSGYATNDIAASLLVPLYGIFALAMAALAYGSFSRVAVKPPASLHFAVTNLRLIALSASGSVTDELAAGDVDGVIAGGRAAAPDIYVLRRDDPGDRRAFAIEHIDRPMEAKTVIEETFLSSMQEPLS